ncbi:phosphatidate cytidylyltransferase [Iodidimonas muriae]|uniref:Phosphatidate cytidylyltransferase n=1 Tax=Iodidimonas muriae TaxID=261467 RepID=A0ABQ2LEF7_9PROT|nr:phosphatidate cytidylyltransferase [Kordiimonadales bacterium JCM 17843]GGO13460.1 phosphatidate cytidylyltransferase [Iodidimonas muriae]
MRIIKDGSDVLVDGSSDEQSLEGQAIPVQSAPSHLMTRVASALILIPLALAAVWLGGDWFAGLLSLVGILMILEWGQIIGLPKRDLGLFLALNLMLVVGFILLPVDMLLPQWAGVTVGLSLYFLLFGAFFKSARPVIWLGLATLYCWTPLYALYWLRGAENGLWLVAWVLLVVWGTDIGGYFVGRSVGGAKLVPQISPNKTWSGLIGGMALAALAGFIGAIWFDLGSIVLLASLGALLAIVGQAGDIVESALKRRFGVKDSGRIIPGHGGVLDRVDGLVFVAPVVALAVALYN